MVTNQEQIDTNSPVVPYAIFLRFVELRNRNFTEINILIMMVPRILFCQVLLLGVALSLPVKSKVTEKKPLEATTHTPLKVSAAKNTNNEQIQTLNNAQTEKSATKKRNVPEALQYKNGYFEDDLYEGTPTEEEHSNQGLRAYLDNYRNENSLFDFGKYRVNDYRYYDADARRKRTAAFDGIFNKGDFYREPEIRLSPEDLIMLAAYRQQHRVYNNFPYRHWGDVNNVIDLPDTDSEIEEIYDKPENFFDRYYDQRYQNWANFPRSNKFSLNRQRRSFMDHSKFRVPIYKRAVL